MNIKSERRKFIRTSVLTAMGGIGISALSGFKVHYPLPATENDLNVVGPREGFTPHIGSLVSMLNWMRFVMLRSVDGMGQKELDYLLDENANSIGAMLFHLAATDKFYYLHTFEGMDANEVMNSAAFKKYTVAMNLGDGARKTIKGHGLDYYMDILEATRESTLTALAKLDDDWLMAVDESFPWGPTNNYCKWFHVCEHESNHNGQIKLIKSRIS